MRKTNLDLAAGLPTLSRLSVIAASLWLAGCTSLAPTYQRPALEQPASIQLQGANVAKDASWQSWWKVLQDPVLESLLQEAASNNQDLALAAARVLEARASADVSHANRSPTVDGNLSASKTRSSQNTGKLPAGASPVSKDFQLGLSAAYELDVWGKLANADNAARARLLAQEANRNVVLTSLYANVTQNYLNLRALDAQALQQETLLQGRRDYSRLLQTRAKAGATTQQEVNLATVELESAQQSLMQTRQAIANSESALALLLGRSPKAIFAPEIARGKDLAALSASFSLPENLPTSLMQRRPDILAAEQALIAANADIGQAKAAYYPTLKLTSSAGYDSRQLSDLINPASLIWNLGTSLIQPIFRGGAIGAVVAGAEARNEQAKAQYVQSVQAGFRDLHDALGNLASNAQIEEANANKLKAQQENLRLAQLRYKTGYSSQLELLNAQRDVAQTQIGMLDAQRTRLLGLVAVSKAVGGGWDVASAGQVLAGK